MWNKTTHEGGTIKAACDYAMTIPPGSSETSAAAELYPEVAAVASKYGDPNNTYTRWLATKEGTGAYVSDATFFWDQPLSDSGYLSVYKPPSNGIHASDSASPTDTATHGKSTVGTVPDNGALSMVSGFWRAWGMLYGACTVVMVVSFTEFL